jgi:hypothetical protein
MNIKLLKELSKQAETECGWSEEKFAELIVRECVDVARQADIDGCNIGNYAWEKIKKHFGVEE